MNWIKIAVGIMRDPKMIALSEAVGVSVPTATGHVVGVLTSMAEGCNTGDLSTVGTGTLEQWAMWRGKRGVFANAFRTYLCNPDGVVSAWDKYNGSALRKLEYDRERKQMEREEKKRAGMSAKSRTDVVRTSDARPRLEEKRGEERTTGGGITTPTPPLLLPAPQLELVSPEPPRKKPKAPKSPKPVADTPAFPKAVCDEMYQIWTSKIGAVDYVVFRQTFAPLFHAPEADRPAGASTNRELVEALKSYADLAPMGAQANWARKIKTAAETLAAVAVVRRDYFDNPDARSDAVMRLIHGRKVPA